MFDYFIKIATAFGAIVLTSVAFVFFGSLIMVVLTSYSLVPMPY
jgi:hypothetical protein